MSLPAACTGAMVCFGERSLVRVPGSRTWSRRAGSSGMCFPLSGGTRGEYEEGADALDHAWQVLDEWERAEPGFRHLTGQHIEARRARRRAELEAERDAQERRQQARRLRHDTAREHARLDLLEQRAVLASRNTELDGLRSRDAYPRMDPGRRARVAELDVIVAAVHSRIAGLESVVGGSGVRS